VSDAQQGTFNDVFEAVRRVVEARGTREPGESLVTYEEGGLLLARTAANEYEVRAGGELVFRSRHTGALSSAHVFKYGGWVDEVRRMDRDVRGQRG
jgi:hypothetical protein